LERLIEPTAEKKEKVKRVSGKYFIKKTAVASSPEAYNEELAQRLWQVSEELAAL
jgi:hypothetical protein